MTKREIAARLDQQKKIGKSLLDFYYEHHTELLFFAALESILKKLARGE